MKLLTLLSLLLLSATSSASYNRPSAFKIFGLQNKIDRESTNYVASCNLVNISDEACITGLETVYRLLPKINTVSHKAIRGFYITNKTNLSSVTIDEYGYLELNARMSSDNVLKLLQTAPEYRHSEAFKKGLLETAYRKIKRQLYDKFKLNTYCSLDAYNCLEAIKSLQNATGHFPKRSGKRIDLSIELKEGAYDSFGAKILSIKLFESPGDVQGTIYNLIKYSN